MFKLSAKYARMLCLALLIILAVAGTLLVLYNTRLGPGLSGDSIIYVQGAQNLLAGNGYSVQLGAGEVQPITGFPPLTSVSLAAAGLFDARLFDAGRWLNALLFGVNIFLAGWLVYRYTRSWLVAAIASAAVMAQATLVVAHSWVMSEGLFILWMLLVIWTLAEYLDGARPPQVKKPMLLVLSAIFTSLSILTRYVGLSLLVTAGLGLLLLHRGGWKRRLGDAVIFGAIAAAPVALWFLRNRQTGGSAVNRRFGLHLMADEMRGLLVDHILSWFYLTEIGLRWRARVLAFLALCAALFGGFAFREFRKAKGEERGAKGEVHPRPLRALPWLLIFFAPVYVVIIWANSSFLIRVPAKGPLLAT